MIPQGGGLASWSIKHPIGVTMIAATVIVLGLTMLNRLAIDLLPKIIYPEIGIRILDEGVPATVMEDQVTRFIEEQLAITEDAINVQSFTDLGKVEIFISFGYGKDLDIALRDASTRLDRAKRELPDTVLPPQIWKRDPAQIPAIEFVISSDLMDLVDLRTWADDSLSKWFINLPGVAAAEIGGGVEREIQIIPDQQRLAGMGLSYQNIVEAIQTANEDIAIGRLHMPGSEITGRISGRLNSVEAIRQIPIGQTENNIIKLYEVAKVIDSSEDERLKIRANGISGIKMAIQKQPHANTNNVVDIVKQQLNWLTQQSVIPPGIHITAVTDQSIYIKQSLKNAASAAISGGILAMLVVYLFLGNLRRTLIIGSAIPIAIMFTFVLMGLCSLTLNIMTLGGLALGVGMLVDNTIVMLENIYRHQCNHQQPLDAGTLAAAEVNGPIVASTSTNLVAILPFLFIGGLTGLLFSELIVTISAAIFASMVIALTLVPAYAAKVTQISNNPVRKVMDILIAFLQDVYGKVIRFFLSIKLLIIGLFIAGLAFSMPIFTSNNQILLPNIDDGRVEVRMVADSGVSVDEMDKYAQLIEHIMDAKPETKTIFTLVGGSVFGRTQREEPSRAEMTVELVPASERDISSQQWIKNIRQQVEELQVAGLRVYLFQQGIRGLRTHSGDQDISLRLQGDDFTVMKNVANGIAEKMRQIPELRNVEHSAEDERFEISIKLNRDRAQELGLNMQDLAEAAQTALQGRVISEYLEGNRSYDIRLRLSQEEMNNPQALRSIILFPSSNGGAPLYLGNVADIELIDTPSRIRRENQMRIVEISAALADEATLGETLIQLEQMREEVDLPAGYTIYDGGQRQALEKQQNQNLLLIVLALFLVLVVMAIQYESLLNPIIILLSVPFSAIGVAMGIYWINLPLSMPIWLGTIMLIGIVVNNAILLVNYIELERRHNDNLTEAVIAAVRLRLRPILMTTLSTVVGMLPLAIGFGEGSEMLQPLAVAVVWGLSFSMMVSLLLVPLVYHLFHSIKDRNKFNHQTRLS